jgi:serine/threonine protein kinase
VPLTPLRPSDPACVGPHRLLGRLGQGGMGTVYLGVSPDERAVAVKVLRDGFPDDDARRRFRAELQALRRVRGPHLVEVLDADVEADTPYLVTRFVPGTRLDDLVTRTGPLPLEDLHRVARGLADALSMLHAAGIVHRDLTPGNVLVLDGQPHVIDLGLATAADVTALTRSGLVIGTPGYLAPEQVTGSAVSPAVDVHAWGATVALAGTGRPPYGTGRPEAVLYRIVHAEPDLEGLPPSVADLVAAAMDPDPARRPDARALLSELGGPTSSPPVTVRLPHDVDATTVLRAPGLQPDPTQFLTRSAVEPVRELATATTGPRAVLPAGGPPPAPDWPPDVDDDEPLDGSTLDEGLPALPSDEPERNPARELQTVVTGTAATGLLGALTLVAPVLGAACALLVLVLLRATGRASDRLQSRRVRRGDRRRDPVVTALASPWYIALALADTLLSLPLLALVAAVPAGLVWLGSPDVSGLERPELTVATGVVAMLLAGLGRRAHAPSRRLLRRLLVRATPGSSSAVAVALGLVTTAVLLLAAAEGAAPVWWPLQEPLP